MKHSQLAVIYSLFLVLVWAVYRFGFSFSPLVEEGIIKPVIWLAPLIYLLSKEGQGLESLGITFKNFFPAVYFALALGALFVLEALFTNYLKYGGLSFAANIGDAALVNSLFISLLTAVTEEVTFRGYIFTRLAAGFKSEVVGAAISTLFWTAIHLPVVFFVWKLTVPAAFVYLFLTTLFGLGSTFVFARTKNIASSVLLHILWEWPIILFR